MLFPKKKKKIYIQWITRNLGCPVVPVPSAIRVHATSLFPPLQENLEWQWCVACGQNVTNSQATDAQQQSQWLNKNHSIMKSFHLIHYYMNDLYREYKT